MKLALARNTFTSADGLLKSKLLSVLFVFCFLNLSGIGELSMAADYPYPDEQELAHAKSGDLIMNTGTFTFKGEELSADFGTLVVPENRSKPDSKLIRLPVVRIHATEKKSEIPVFTLQGGPGDHNISMTYSKWLYLNQDIVMVGYRGVDGSISLECPEIVEAMNVDVDPLSPENLEKLGNALYAGFQRLKKEGIDIDRYTLVDVIDDIETARAALGYEKINLWGHSYGTQISFVYCVKYPNSINRNFMSGTSAIGAIWEPEIVDRQLNYYADLWQKNPECIARAPDLIKTIRTVLERLPTQWHGIVVDPGKVKMMTFLNLYNTGSAAQVFDAFVAAENGDYSGLAYLSFLYNRVLPKILNWGDFFSKFLSASDAHASRKYDKTYDPPRTIIGSPFQKIILVPQKHGGWPIKPISEAYKNGTATVETVVINGSIDFSSPFEYTKDRLLPKLLNCRVVLLSEMGHHDVYNLQMDAYRHLYNTFFLTGEVDESKFEHAPVNFTPTKTFHDLAQALIK